MVDHREDCKSDNNFEFGNFSSRNYPLVQTPLYTAKSVGPYFKRFFHLGSFRKLNHPSATSSQMYRSANYKNRLHLCLYGYYDTLISSFYREFLVFNKLISSTITSCYA